MNVRLVQTAIPKNLKTNLVVQYLEIQILTENGLVSPEDLKSIELPDINYFGVVIGGKAPIWLYQKVLCELLTLKDDNGDSIYPEWIANYDPRLGCVIVFTDNFSQLSVGDIITFA